MTSDEESESHIVGVIFDQHFSLNRCLKLFGDKTDVAVQKELSKIHTMDTYEPIMKSSLTIEDSRKALALMSPFLFSVMNINDARAFLLSSIVSDDFIMGS